MSYFFQSLFMQEEEEIETVTKMIDGYNKSLSSTSVGIDNRAYSTNGKGTRSLYSWVNCL